MHKLRFRQVHLDFHTSPEIPELGISFDKGAWQKTLQDAAVNSITAFATCHHGWAYYDTTVGRRHPHLSFDLLRAQYEASKEIDINVPIYLTAGSNNLFSYLHPEWREIDASGRYYGWAKSPLEAGFHKLCFNTPYLDILCDQIAEVVRLFPACDGIFLDIVMQGPCCCRWCMDSMREKGYDPQTEDDRYLHAQEVLVTYYQRATAAARIANPAMPIFHNSGHIEPGQTEKLVYFSHLELESLPTGGWGYDHFPMSAKYCTKLPFDFLGMTGKFHTSWGEFGGYKSPQALKYECCAMLAVGAKCSIGDQLHPCGKLDETTYRLIGEAYRDVAAKEEWCEDVEPISDIALLSVQCINNYGRKLENLERSVPSEIGAGRVLLEGHFLFDVLDADMDFMSYKLLIIPDDAIIYPKLKGRIDAFLHAGGKLIITGTSGIARDMTDFLWDVGAAYCGQNDYQVDYMLPKPPFRAEFCDSPQIMYLPSQRIQVTSGTSLGDIYNPYFNRTYLHFCSHQHAPNQLAPSAYASGVQKSNIVYLAHPVFTLYHRYGSVVYKEYLHKVLRHLLADDMTLICNMPSQARVFLMRQDKEQRTILHLLYAPKILRGSNSSEDHIFSNSFEVIDELVPLANIDISLKAPVLPSRITLEPQGDSVTFSIKQGRIHFHLPAFTCHQMIVLHDS